MITPSRVAAVVLAGAGIAGVALWSAAAAADLSDGFRGRAGLGGYPAALVGGAAVMGVGWAAARRAPRRFAVGVVLLAGALFRLVLVPTPPALSDDAYRYLWDGRVQAAGIAPYRYPPAAPELAGLRDGVVWPRVNRPHAVTIYPPLAQAIFHGAHGVGLRTPTGWKLFVVAVDIAASGLLVLALRRLGRDPAAAVAYVWNPLPVLAFGHSGHVDAVVVAALLGAVLAWVANRRVATGLLLGVAGGVKLAPLALLPGFLRPPCGRWSTRGAAVVVVGALAVVAAGYVPFASMGTDALGFLADGYLVEEGYASGRRFRLFRAVGLDGRAFAVPVLGAVAVAALRSRRDAASRAAWLAAAGVLLVLAYPWYAAPLLALAVAGGTGWAWPWFAVVLEAAYASAIAGTLARGLPHDLVVAAAAGIVALLALSTVSRRARRAVRGGDAR